VTPEQQAHPVENRETVARVVAKWHRFGFLSDADQRRLMIALQNMLMACDNTYLSTGRPASGRSSTNWPPSSPRCSSAPTPRPIFS